MKGPFKPGAAAEPAYQVGYGKPPVKHRFEKGKSGNPRGRPKGSRNKADKHRNLEIGTQPANQMLLEEAYRTVTVREGDTLIELPAIKAVFRAMGVAAMKGNRLAQATMAELVRGVEEEDRKARADHFEVACEYKRGWEEAIERAQRSGLPVPEPLPHPDDVIIDVRTSQIRYEGPITKEEKHDWDRLLAFRDEQQAEVTFFADAYRRNAAEEVPPSILDGIRDSWERETRLYDKVNDPLPQRYRKPLEDRFRPSRLLSSAQEKRNDAATGETVEGRAASVGRY